MWISVLLLLFFFICFYDQVFAYPRNICTISPPLQNKCGCYSVIRLLPPVCGEDYSLYWCSNNLKCDSKGCRGNIILGNGIYCSDFKDSGRVLFEEYENCGRTDVIRKIYAYLGDKSGKSFDIPTAIVSSDGKTGFTIASNAASKFKFFFSTNENKLGGFIKGKTVYFDSMAGDGGDCGTVYWHLKVTKVSKYASTLVEDESEFLNGCPCQYSGAKPATKAPTGTPLPDTISGPKNLASSPLLYQKGPYDNTYFILQSEDGSWKFGINQYKELSFWKYEEEFWVPDHTLDTYKSASGNLTAEGDIISLDYYGNFAFLEKGTNKISWETGSSKMNAGANGGYTLSLDNNGLLALTAKKDSFVYWNSKQPISRAWSSTTKYEKGYLFLKNDNWKLVFETDGAFHLYSSNVPKWISPAGSYFKFIDGNLIIYDDKGKVVWAALNYPQPSNPSMMELTPLGEIRIRIISTRNIVYQCINPWNCPSGKKV